MSSVVEIRVPDLGNLEGAEVIDVNVAVGAAVAAEATLLQLESEKAVMELTSPQAGHVTEILVKRGERVTSGQLVARLATAGSPAPSIATAGVSSPAPQAPSAAPEPAVNPSPPTHAQRIYAGPAARRLARELGVDLALVRGSAARGRIVRDDVKRHVRSRPADSHAPIAAVAAGADLERFGPVNYEPLSRIQKISARRLTASWCTIPHVTQHDDADVTELEALRQSRRDALEAQGVRLTLLAFLLRAVAITLAEMPRFNASLCPDGERLALRRYCNLGFAVDTDQGLVVPVVHDARHKDVYELARELSELSALARAGKLVPAQMQGATFTVSSLGGVGGTHFTPIINPPEVAILGAGRARRVAHWGSDRIEARMSLPISLSYDHRVIDGVAGVRFTGRICALLADPATLFGAVP